MRVLSKENLDIEFQKFYAETGIMATHVFIHSFNQDRIISDSFDPLYSDGKKCYVNGQRYSEMRCRDSDLEFGHNDSVFVCVGNHSDITRK